MPVFRALWRNDNRNVVVQRNQQAAEGMKFAYDLWPHARPHPGLPVCPPAQVAQQLVEGAAVEVLRVDDDMIAPPLQTPAVAGREINLAPDNQHHRGRGRSWPESLLEELRWLLVIKQ